MVGLDYLGWQSCLHKPNPIQSLKKFRIQSNPSTHNNNQKKKTKLSSWVRLDQIDINNIINKFFNHSLCLKFDTLICKAKILEN